MKLGSRLVVFIIVLILCGSLFPLYQIPQVTGDLINKNVLTNHNSILINGNFQFNQTNGVVSGSGTKGDPYIIENWTINSTNTRGIRIEHTDSYFVIENCHIFGDVGSHSMNDGISFYNVTNGEIKNCRINNNSWGIIISISSNISVFNTSIIDNKFYGLSIYNTENIDIISNNISNNNYSGIGIIRSKNIELLNNTIFNNNGDGVFIDSCISAKLMNNAINNNTYNFGIKGMEVEHFIHNITEDNSINSKPIYYWVNQSDKKVFGNAGFVGLVNCSNITISNLSLNSNYNGIIISMTSNSTIENNEIYNNSEGISIWNSTNLTVKNNTCYQNGNTGIGIFGSNYCNIISNNCSYNKVIGIGLAEANRNYVDNNICSYHDNGYGIFVRDSENNTFSNNSCNNDSTGIYIVFSKNNKILNSNFNFSYNSGITLAYSGHNDIINNDVCFISGDIGKGMILTYGFQIYYSSNNTFSNNNCSSNFEGFLLKKECHNNLIINNTFSFNEKSGLIIYEDSHFSLISNNTFRLNKDGLVIINSDSLNISNNSFNSDRVGINIYSSKRCNLTNNKFTQSGIFINGDIEYWNSHNIPTSNIINEKPVYYLKNQTDIVVPVGAGGIILANCTNIDIADQNLSNSTVGILAGYTNNLSISNTTCDSNNNYGINLYYTDENQIVNTTCNSNDNIGIYFYHSDNNTIIQTTSISNTNEGIKSYYSSNTIIKNCNCSFNSGGGISIGDGINRIENTTCNNNCNFGIKITDSEQNIIGNNTCNFNNGSDHVYGMYIESSNYNLIINNTCNLNLGLYTGYGIRIENSNFNNISKNTCNFHKVGATGYGIFTSNLNYNFISKNNCSNNEGWGLTINGKSNEIKENYFYSSDPAIVLRNSENSTLTDNEMYNCGIFINAADLKYWNTHNITTTNIVNGRPVRYFKNKNGGTVLQGAGQIILAKCSNMKIENQTISNGSDGIIIGYSDYIKVLNNTVYGNAKHAISQRTAQNNIIKNNTIYNNNDSGIFNTFSDNNLFEQNNIFNNTQYGIHFYRSIKNTIKSNILKNNFRGINLLSYSSNNLIYNNYFSNQNNYFEALRISNTWSVSKNLQQNIIGGPYLGGNYWSDYNGTDLDGDGLGDTKVPFGPGDSRPLCQVNDTTSPSMADTTTSSPTTGEKFNLTVSASDLGGVDRVCIEYWCDQGKPANKTMSRISGNNRSGIYSYMVDIPSDGKLLNYQFSAKDLFGNWKDTSIIMKNIIDNDKPVLDDRSGFPVTGEYFDFIVFANDNLNIAEVNVEYWFDAELIDDITLSTEEDYYLSSILIPINTKILKYTVSAKDDSDNLAALEMRIVNVIDNITPKIIDNSDSEATTGDDFTFDFDITDNIELTTVYLEYWFDDDDHIKFTLPNTHTYDVTVPPDAFYLNAKVTALDPSGNYDELNISLKVLDNDAPEVKVIPIENLNTGAEFIFKWIINENRLLKNVTFEYEFSDHIHHSVPMELAGGEYTLKIDVPIDAWIFFYAITVYDKENFIGISGNITVNDTIPPKIHDLTEGQPTTGEYFEIKATAEDNIGIQLFELEYWFDDNSSTKIVLNENYSIMVPKKAKILYYKLHVMDSSKNSVIVENSIKIKEKIIIKEIDDEKPVIKVYGPDFATTGERYNISGSVSDNIFGKNVTIEHRFFDKIEKTELEFDYGIYGVAFTWSVLVPVNATEFNYKIIAKDTSNNTQIYERKIRVLDNDKPSFEDNSYELDENYTFSFVAKDNIGISKVTVFYSFNAEDVQKEFLSLYGTDYEKTIQIPENTFSLNYYIIVEDSSGNTVESNVEEIIFDDNIEPVPKPKIRPEEKQKERNIWLAAGLVVVLIIILIILVLIYIRTGKERK